MQLGLRTTGPGTGLQLLVNGSLATTVTPPVMNGFGPGQAPNLIVGNISGVDLDDLRFYNRALTSSELCTILVRGQPNAAGACTPLIPGFELDFENNQVINTGNWTLNLSPPSQASFVPTPLGTGIRLPTTTQSFLLSRGFAGLVSQAPGHSFSFWFVAGSGSETLIDFSRDCGVAAFATCGIAVTYSSGALNVVAGNGGMTPFSRTIPVATGLHSVLVTEKKAADRTTTLSLSIYIDGLAPVVMQIGSGNVYASTSDIVTLPHAAGTTVDEYEFWPRDLSLDPEMLCENGMDGEWDPAANVCLLTSN